MRGTVCLAVVLALASVARADDVKTDSGPPAFHIGPTATWVMLGGVTTGGTVALADRGYFVGGELSFALMRVGDYMGVYGDGYYDWGTAGTYTTAGIELGHKYIGVDGGLALRFDNETRVGFAARASVGIGLAQVYVRYMHFPTGVGDMPIPNDNVLQVGVELKLPIHTFASE